MEILPGLVSKLVSHEPQSKGLKFAAVSMVLHEGASPTVLLIERARRTGDPWSGQIAFPGGKMQEGDRTAKDTAVRETLEEVGVDLDESGVFLGYGEVTTTHTGTMDVVPTVFVLKRPVEIRPNEEVASFRWVKLEDLLAPSAESSYELTYEGKAVQMPAFSVGGYVISGLTNRNIGSLLGAWPPGATRR